MAMVSELITPTQKKGVAVQIGDCYAGFGEIIS